jgi:D-xylose 1-dehydrogenase (NADP+, D-xylono-1,5-lactone-forming)
MLAVASRSLGKAREFAAEFGVERAFGSYEELLEDPDVQAVYIPLPNILHHEWTIKAAQSGKHILCEKPFACNAQQAQEMVDACQTHGAMVMEAFAQRFQPQNLLIKKLVDQGLIGKVLMMNVVHSSARPTDPNDVRLKKELCGGVLMDKGCYCVNQARFFFGEEPVAVYARAEFGQESGVDERVVATLHFPGGGAAVLDTSFKLQGSETYYQSYELLGETGRIFAPKGLTQVETYRRGEVTDRTFFVTDNSGTETVTVKGVHHWQLEAEFFADQVLKGVGIEFPGENGLANTLVMDAIFESARSGRVVVPACR